MRSRPALRSLATAGALVVLLVAVRAAATGALSTPEMSSLDAFAEWVDAAGPASVAMSVLRLGTEIALWYLVIVALVHAVAALTQAVSVSRFADVLATPLPRRVVRLAVGVSLATTASPLALSGDQPTRTSPTTTMVALDDASAAAPMMERLVEAPGDVAVGGPVSTSDLAVGGPVAPEPAPTPAKAEAAIPSAPHSESWTVTSGESFWTMAAETVSEDLGRPASDAEIVPYWQALIEVNRHRLVRPDDADLILPGQVFELPTIPSLR